MPCTYYTPEEKCRIASEELNKLTRLLCEAARLLDEVDSLPRPMSQELIDWLIEHKRLDALREQQAREKFQQAEKRREALRKLSPEERKVLGL